MKRTVAAIVLGFLVSTAGVAHAAPATDYAKIQSLVRDYAIELLELHSPLSPKALCAREPPMDNRLGILVHSDDNLIFCAIPGFDSNRNFTSIAKYCWDFRILTK